MVASRPFLNALGTAHERQLHGLWRDPAAWTRSADVFVVLTALATWSTSLVAIFAVAWLLTLVPTLDIKYFIQTLKRPICVLPIALFGLAAVGTFWSDTPWVKRLYAINPTAKLLVLPAPFYHFERSSRGIERFYNATRRHSTIGYLSPVEFERKVGLA